MSTGTLIEHTPGGYDHDQKTHGREKATDSRAFKRWFGDSKLVDENGEPVVVYHGVKGATVGGFQDGQIVWKLPFEAFDKGKIEAGVYFSPDPKVASQYGVPVPFYIRAENPVRHEDPIKDVPKGADSIYRMRGKGDDITQAWEIAVFDPKQIKLAFGNKGSFDPKSPSIVESTLIEHLPGRHDQKTHGRKKATDSETFRKWFGKSKVVDENGEPLVVYHGTPGPDFDEFSASPEKRNTANESAGLGIWFSDSSEVASAFVWKEETEYKEHPIEKWSSGEPKVFAHHTKKYGGIYPVYLKINNPKVYGGEDGFESMMDDRSNSRPAE